jgi:hypothetical protein
MLASILKAGAGGEVWGRLGLHDKRFPARDDRRAPGAHGAVVGDPALARANRDLADRQAVVGEPQLNRAQLLSRLRVAPGQPQARGLAGLGLERARREAQPPDHRAVLAVC